MSTPSPVPEGNEITNTSQPNPTSSSFWGWAQVITIKNKNIFTIKIITTFHPNVYYI